MERNRYEPVNLRRYVYTVDLEKVLSLCEDWIRAGQIEKARFALKDINVAQVTDRFRQPLAFMCRRVGLLNLGMRVLTPPLMDDRDKWIMNSPPGQVAEYAILLQRIGMVNQALSILNRVDVNHVPEALLYRAFCHFNLWQYAEAVPLLEHYVTTPLPEYRKTIGQVNLIAAMIGGEQFDRAEKLIEEVLRATAAGGFGRLRANCHELASQIYIQRRDFPRAKESLKAALEILQASNTIDQLFVQKGLAIMSAAESQSIAPLVGFRTEALQRRDWESVRESDLYILKTEFDPSRFSHLIFGSPLPAYRRRVYKELGRMAEGNSYLFGDPNADEMDLMSGEVKGRDNLRAGSKTHQVIEVLLRDLYKPLSIGGLFAELFPEEYFNAFSSPDRVHQILRRSRKWLAENKLPVEIVEFQQSYSIQMTGPFAFRCPLYRGIVNWHEVHMRQLEGATSARKTLRADQLKGVLGLEGSPFRRFTDWAVKNDRLERVGAGRATAYRIKKAA